jgi:ribosome-associated translation inhibitor RaiA
MTRANIKYVKQRIGWRCNMSVDYIGNHLYVTARGDTKQTAYNKAYRKLSTQVDKVHKTERKRRRHL